MNLLIVTLSWGFWWHVSTSLRVRVHIFVCLAEGNRGSKSRVGYDLWWNSVAIWSLQSLRQRVWKGENRAKGEGKTKKVRIEAGREQEGGKCERKKEEKRQKWRTIDNNSSYSKLRDNMKASPQSVYCKTTVWARLRVCVIALVHLLQAFCVCVRLSVCVITLIPLHTTGIAAGFAKLTLKCW